MKDQRTGNEMAQKICEGCNRISVHTIGRLCPDCFGEDENMGVNTK